MQSMNLSTYMQRAITTGNVNAVKRFLWIHQGNLESINARVSITRRFFLTFGGDTALTLAIKKGQVGIVKILLESNDIDVNKCDAYGFTPLMMAIQFRFDEIAKLLNRKDIQLEAQMPAHGTTAIFYAIEYDAKDIKAELLARGANPEHLNRKGQMAEQTAGNQMISINERLNICFR
jgi:ankyrin repeat protein